MFRIQKRWPVLTALAAALAYGFNNYQLAGVEHLRLQPRSASMGTATTAPSGLTSFPNFEYSLNAAQDIFGNGPPVNLDSLPPWNDMLSVGEKLSIWQDGQKNAAAASTGPAPAASFPITSPIPVPPDLNVDFSVSGPGAPVAYPNLLPVVSPDSLPSTLKPLPQSSNPQPEAPAGSFVTAPQPRVGGTGVSSAAAENRIRIASFNLEGLGPAKLAKPQVMEMLVRMLRQYDVVALQEVRSTRDDILPILVERLNQSGRSFDYLIGPRVGRANVREQFAFIFDTSRVETDRFQLYTVDDPEDLMTYDPLVAWFRCKGVAKEKAFTFSLVNINLDPHAAASEQALLPNLIAAIERDGRQEDDWILLGDFEGSSSQLSNLHQEGVRFGIQGVPTDVSGERMLDTFVFSSRGTTEFTGRSGVFDFLRKFNLSLENALEVSGHLPIWAEFSIVEGSEPGRIAPVTPVAIQ